MPDQTWVLLRGLVREQRHWESFPGVLASRLPAGTRVVMVDLPGNGTHCREPSELYIRDVVDALRRDLAARQVEGPYSLLALSLGAMTAFEWMSRYPGEVERAVLANTSLSALSPVWHRLRPANWAGIVRHGLFGSAEARERLILGITTNLVPDREVYVRRWVAYARERPVSTRNAVVQLLSAALYRKPALPPSCPVLVLNGGGDRLVDPRCSDRIAEVFGLPLERHPTAGHDLSLDAPEWVADRVAAFASGAGRR